MEAAHKRPIEPAPRDMKRFLECRRRHFSFQSDVWCVFLVHNFVKTLGFIVDFVEGKRDGGKGGEGIADRAGIERGMEGKEERGLQTAPELK